MSRLTPPTPGTQMMLWTYPLVTLVYGALYLFQSPARLRSGAFEQAKALMPLHVWGLVFVVVASLKLACILVGTPRAYVVMMCLGAALFSFWGFLFLASALTNPTASFTGCLLPFGWTIAHLAMLATMTRARSVTHG